MSMTKDRIELEIILKTREIIQMYRRYNPKGNYLNISFLQTEEKKGRIHINNAFYDRDHLHSIDITEDISL